MFTKQISHRLFIVLVLLPFLLSPLSAFADNKKVLKTRYADILFADDAALSDFLWRISGQRFDAQDDPPLARSRVDRIIDRVQFILDMRPDDFHVRIDIYPRYTDGMIAHYSHKTNSITVYADKVTDGVFAHEAAHAVICNYFPEQPPDKIQEILAQYVDKHLWSDY